IVYPWAVHEDLVGFTERVLSDSDLPMSPDQIRADLKRRFDIDLDEDQMAEILEDLVDLRKGERLGPAYRVNRC
ncbi:MAG: phosphoribosyltransferase, partial [Methanothrix sp.]